MLACVNETSPKSLGPFGGEKVVFKNVGNRYKLNENISVEYILSPKTETSSKDFIGIYHRDWKDLKEFVAFEHTITPPSEEPSLYRCIQFICRPHLLPASPNQDYQFVYVTHTHEVLGRSSYFQFIADSDRETTSDTSSESSQKDFTNRTLQNVSINLTPEEIAYNQCFFRNNHSETLNLASSTCYIADNNVTLLNEASNAYFVPKEIDVQTLESDELMMPKKGRPLVKTRDGGYLDMHHSSHIPLQQFQRQVPVNQPYCNYPQRHDLEPHQEVPVVFFPVQSTECVPSPSGPNTGRYWSPTGQWNKNPKQGKWKRDTYFPNATLPLPLPLPLPVKAENKWGAVPKKCSKCKAPPDFNQQQQIMQHELDQAREEIRDLRAEVEHLKHVVELAEAGQAKLRVTAEIARKEGRFAITFLNNLMFSLVNHHITKIINFDNTVMYVSREIKSPGWQATENAMPTLICGRPSSIKVVSARDKELKAIIGRQEMKIRDLHSRLTMASRVIEQANLLDLKVEIPKPQQVQILNSPQMTPHPEENSAEIMKEQENNKVPSGFHLAELDQVLNSIEGHTYDGEEQNHESQEVVENTFPAQAGHAAAAGAGCGSGNEPSKHNQCDSNSPAMQAHWPEVATIERHAYFTANAVQYGDHEIIQDEDGISFNASNGIVSGKPKDSNNNIKHMNNNDSAQGSQNFVICDPGISSIPGIGMSMVEVHGYMN